MYNRKNSKEKLMKLFKLTEDCYDALETANAMLKLIYEKYPNNKTVDVALNMTITNIKNATELILKIQDNI